jgi:hypothetical protein
VGANGAIRVGLNRKYGKKHKHRHETNKILDNRLSRTTLLLRDRRKKSPLNFIFMQIEAI